MIHRDRFRSAPRWLLPIVVTLLVFGHVCELAAFADLVVPFHPTEDRSAEGHGHESELSCDPLDAVSNTTGVPLASPIHGIAQSLPAGTSVPGWLVASSSIERYKRLASRLPLFVLHAALLI